MNYIMKQNKKKLMLTLAVCLLGTTGVFTGSATTVYAATPTVSQTVLQVMKQSKPVLTTNAKVATGVKLVIDGVPQQLQDPMLEENGRVFLPIRQLGKLLGINVDYLDKEKVALASNDNAYLELPLGYNQAVKDKSLILPIDKGNKNTRIFTYKSRTYLPVRFISENLGIEISYSNQTVTINTGKGGTVTPKPEQPKPEQPKPEKPNKPSDELYDLSGIKPSDPTNPLNLQALQDGRSLYNAPKTPLSQLKKPEGMNQNTWNNLINLGDSGVMVNARLSDLPEYINFYSETSDKETIGNKTCSVPTISVDSNGLLQSSGSGGAPTFIYFKDGTFADATDGSDVSVGREPGTGKLKPGKGVNDIACITIADVVARAQYIILVTGK